MCNTLQKPKYLKIDNSVKFLSVKIGISSRNYLSNKTKIIHQFNCQGVVSPIPTVVRSATGVTICDRQNSAVTS